MMCELHPGVVKLNRGGKLVCDTCARGVIVVLTIEQAQQVLFLVENSNDHMIEGSPEDKLLTEIADAVRKGMS